MLKPVFATIEQGLVIRTLAALSVVDGKTLRKVVGLEESMDAALVSRNMEGTSGALCFTGTRVPVKNLFDYLEGNSSLDEFLEDFPSVKREIAVAVLEVARAGLAANAAGT